MGVALWLHSVTYKVKGQLLGRLTDQYSVCHEHGCTTGSRNQLGQIQTGGKDGTAPFFSRGLVAGGCGVVRQKTPLDCPLEYGGNREEADCVIVGLRQNDV